MNAFSPQAHNADLKQQICDALAVWIRQRPGLDYGNYVSPGTVSREQIESGRRAYFKEVRDIARDKRDAETLLAAVRWRDSITAEHLLEAAKRAFSGRLEIRFTPTHHIDDSSKVQIEYCTGQYWPTEYRKAAAAVLASALHSAARADMPKPNGLKTLTRLKGDPAEYTAEFETIDGLPAGDWLRRHFRKEFGSALQRRWFN